MYFLCYLTAGRNMAREYIHILSLGCMCHFIILVNMVNGFSCFIGVLASFSDSMGESDVLPIRGRHRAPDWLLGRSCVDPRAQTIRDCAWADVTVKRGKQQDLQPPHAIAIQQDISHDS